MSGLYKPAPDYDTKITLHRGVAGKIVKWDGERGFGFVRTNELADDIFFHAKHVVAQSELTPQPNENITVFAKYDDGKKRWTATKITSPEREQITEQRIAESQQLFRPMPQLRWVVPAAALWLLAVLVCFWKLAAIYTVISGVAFVLYARDKHLAIHHQNGNRIPENSLHAVALLGGWAGALLARYAFRHKTQKQPFVGIFWATVALNAAATAYLLMSGSLNGW